MAPPDPAPRFSERWRAWRASVDLDEYDERWVRLAAQGRAVHGEADAVARLGGGRVLDGGCGTGRVAVELARRGCHVVGVDNDPDMLERARRHAPQLRWVEGDLATVELGEAFDVVVLAGNVLLFVAPGSEPAVVANLARHLAPGGCLVAGWSLDGGPAHAERHDRWCAAAGLVPEVRWATWEGKPYDGGGYVVAVHRRLHDPSARSPSPTG